MWFLELESREMYEYANILKPIKKDSFYYYKEVIETNGSAIDKEL